MLNKTDKNSTKWNSWTAVNTDKYIYSLGASNGSWITQIYQLFETESQEIQFSITTGTNLLPQLQGAPHL